LVVEQTVAHLQQVKRMTTLLGGTLGIAADRLFVVINRFQRRVR
jgi:hypothetical protein